MNIWREFLIAMICIAGVIVALILISTESEAQHRQFCDSERAMEDMLFRNFMEFKVWAGDDARGGRLILTRADGEGSWTLLSVSDGRACISAAGSRSRFDKGI